MKLLSPTQVAEMAGVSHTTVKREIERGHLRAYKAAGQIRVKEADLEDWLQPIEPKAARVGRALKAIEGGRG